MGTFTTYFEDKNDVEIEVKISYDYERAEPATRYYPGCEAGIVLTQIDAKINGKWAPYDPVDNQEQQFESEAWSDMEAYADTFTDY